VQENSDQIWKYQRYKLVYEYADAAFFPPPIAFLFYFYLIVKWIRKIATQNRRKPKKSIQHEGKIISVQKSIANTH
jgi:hypothetical protein